MAALQAFAWFRERVVQIPRRFLPRHENFHDASLVPRSRPLSAPATQPSAACGSQNQAKRVASTAWLGIIRPPDRSALPWHCLCSKEVEDDEDDIAERAVHFGGVAVGTARMVARRSSLAEYSGCHHTRQTASPLRTSDSHLARSAHRPLEITQLNRTGIVLRQTTREEQRQANGTDLASCSLFRTL